MTCNYTLPSEKVPGYTCLQCQADNNMPNGYCCLFECGEHEFCRGCHEGIYLKNSKGEQS